MKARENDFRKKTWTIPSICTLLYFRYCSLDYPVNILVNTIWARRHRLPKRRPKPPKYVCMVLMFTTKLQGSHRRHWFHLFNFNTQPPPLTAQHIPNSPAPSKAHRIIPGFSPFPGPINNIGVKHETFATKVKIRWVWPQAMLARWPEQGRTHEGLLEPRRAGAVDLWNLFISNIPHHTHYTHRNWGNSAFILRKRG